MAGTITRDDLAGQLAERAEITMVAAREEVNWFFDTIAGALRSGDEVRIHGFGNFSTAQRAARTARNPRTGDTVKVPARQVVKFKPSSTLSDSLKKPAARGRTRKA